MRRLPLPRRGLLLAAAGVLALLVAGWFWIRDSPLVAVERVTISGTSGPDAPKIEAALRGVARDMTTLHVRTDELRRAVAEYPTVGDVRADADLPHGLRIEVIERTAVAVVGDGEGRVPVTASGLVLRGATAGDDLPSLRVDGRAEARVDDPRARRLLTLLGAAPAPLLRRAARAFVGPRGLTLEMEDGPDLYFGGADDLRAKWAAAARVLADPNAEGADYIDVRVPERVAAGGLVDPVEPGAEDGSAPVPGTGEPAPGAPSQTPPGAVAPQSGAPAQTPPSTVQSAPATPAAP